MPIKNIKKPTIGVIGGAGAMGKWFVKFFKEQGYKILISDKKTKLSNQQLATKSNVIIFSVPIAKTPRIIKTVIPYVMPGCLLTDLTSIKTEAIKEMLKADKTIEVVGMHPMFGPTVKNIKNQTVIVCPARGKKWVAWLKNSLIQKGAKIKISTAKKHDQIMSVVQGLTHFSAIAMACAFKELKIDLKETLDFVSPVYKMRMNSIGRILAQNPELYAEIEIANPASVKTIKRYIQVADKLANIIRDKKEDEFVKYFKKAAKFLGNFKKRAMKESDYLIEKLSER